MSKAGMDRAFSEAEASHKARVIKATWGHLDPECGHAYRGAITIAIGIRTQTILNYKFRGLCDSPLLGMTVGDILDRVPSERPGSVYVWLGHLVRYKNGKTKLTRGKLMRCKVIAPVKVRVDHPKPKRVHTPIVGHEYLVQGHGKAVPVNDIATYRKYEVLDLTGEVEVVFVHESYDACKNWVDGKPLDAPRHD